MIHVDMHVALGTPPPRCGATRAVDMSVLAAKTGRVIHLRGQRLGDCSRVREGRSRCAGEGEELEHRTVELGAVAVEVEEHQRVR